MKPLRVSHIINDLPIGGAEMMLHKLLKRLGRSRCECSVISLMDRGPMGEKIESLGIPVEAVGMRRGIPSPSSLARLTRLLRRQRPDVVQCWLYHSNLLGGLAAKLVGIETPVVWNIRINSLKQGIDKRTTFWTVKLCGLLSRRLPARIVINSEEGRNEHLSAGFARDRLLVIPNGFDLDLFRPSETARQAIRSELGIGNHTPLIGAVGRDHPHKDYGNFVRAAVRIARRMPETHFLLCGKNLTCSNPGLTGDIRQAGLAERFHLLGRRDDVPNVQASLDVAVSSSCAEGFPNVIGEAMACGVPCVVTDVGASADVVGQTGRVVPACDSEALSAACLDLLQMPSAQRRKLGTLARRHIEQNFSIDSVAELYMKLWRELIETRHGDRLQTERKAA